MSNFQNLKTLFVTLVPIAIPYAISTYRKFRTQSIRAASLRRPLPQHVSYALNILFFASVAFTIASCYAFSYENLITDTASRIQTPSNVLWERVAARRPHRVLTELDEKLKTRLASTDGRCLYLMYGPETVGNCPFCNSDDPKSFFYYAIPELFLPHLLNFIVLGLATSKAIAGREGSRFRTLATVVGCVLALVEVTAWSEYDWKANARVTRGENLFQFYGWIRLAKSVGFAMVDAGFAAFLWATATNRLMVVPPSATERVDDVLRQLEVSGGKMAAAGIIRNATARDDELRNKSEEYFKRDMAGWNKIMKEEEVQKSMRLAQSQGRLDISKIEVEAGRYAENLIPALGAEPQRWAN